MGRLLARRRRPDRRWALLLLAVWLVTAVPVAVALFLTGSRTVVLAGHDTDLEPTMDGYATVDLGPFLPSFRTPSGSRLGASLDLGPTDLRSYDALVQRYALLASQPEGQIAKVRATLRDMAVDSAVLGGLVALAAPGAVLLVGRRRWAELLHPWTARRTTVASFTAFGVVAAVGLGFFVEDSDGPTVSPQTWQPLASALPGVQLPEEAADLEVESGLITSGTRRLVESALRTYRTSLTFYRDLVAAVPAVADQLRSPQPDEVVGILVSDRHDNIGMDQVVRAVADAGGARFLLDAGDDTSTGGSWEAFSLDSLDQAFDDYDDRYAVAGNHDNGDFVTDYLAERGFTTLVGEPVGGPEGIRLLGASDVRSSGLGSWRDQKGQVTFGEQRTLLAEAACAEDARGERISTLLVHDASSGSEALERGCVDLVLGGHLHAQVGPSPVVGENGEVGFAYTNGTTGGAAYAVALGSKLRRDAQVTLVTYREGEPVGLQPVTIRTTGQLQVSPWIALDLAPRG